MTAVPEFFPGPAKGDRDYSLSRDGATILQRKIEQAWAACGIRVKCTVQPIRPKPGARVISYTIKSDLLNGKPRQVAE